jgi:hypothetical protein
VTLAYVFWHTPAQGLDADNYEAALSAFHLTLSVPSASFRLARLPFGALGADHGAQPAYEAWYLVADWPDLGDLNADAINGARRAPHDEAARLSAHGWGGVYALKRGPAEPPRSVRWMNKPADQSYDAFTESLGAVGIWQRQMVLGPAPEFCLVDGSEDSDADRMPVVYRP